MTERIGVIHPGAMGVSVAASARMAGRVVAWASEGRSEQTAERATKHGLQDVGTVAELCRSCAVLLSVVPPHAAEDVAREVVGYGFGGIYVDANAIAPERAHAIAAILAQTGADMVDGGIVGGPAWRAGTTWLYLSGSRADEVAALLEGGPLGVIVLGPEIGAASALKMCYAAYSKGTTALLTAILATAGHYGVEQALAKQWERDNPGFADQAVARVRGSASKAWRFAGEMDEIAATFGSAGLPGGFHLAAAELYRRLASYKDADPPPGLEAILASAKNDTSDT